MLPVQFKILLLLAMQVCCHTCSAYEEISPSSQNQVTLDEQERAFNEQIISQEQLDKDIITPESLESCGTILFATDELQNKSSISELTRKALQVRLHYSVYSDLLMQRYDSFSELKHSGDPRADQHLCLRQLAHLNHRAELQSRDNYASKDINLALLLDTYGRRPSSVYLGSGLWPGDYRECERLTIETPEGAAQTRYCVAHLRHKSWKRNDSPMDRMTVMKSGVCLPRSCDSLNHGIKHDLVLSLMISGKIIPNDSQVELTSLYCLPDEESPLRTWWLQPSTVIVLVSLLLWLMLLTYATIMSPGEHSQEKIKNSKILKSLSIKNNLELLFRTDQSKGSGRQSIVDLSVADGVKVIALVYVIMGHVIMCMMLVLDISQETTRSFLFTMANMAPGFAVNIFFAITGLLTAYTIFKQSQPLSFMNNPFKWAAFIVHRYLRLMPIYIIMVAYSKYLAKYVGSGPFWDYGTSALATRRTCEQESWFWTLSLTANFKSPLTHCIPSAWYLADDFQFFLIAPFFLAVLKANAKLGKTLLIVSITAVYWINFFGVITNELDDLIPVAQFMPHGFRNYVVYLHDTYTLPHYRIGAYLCGLLFGFYLSNYEKRWLQFLADKESPTMDKGALQNPDWPAGYKKSAPVVSCILMALMISSPFISAQIPFNKTSARIMTALATPYYHIVYALAISFFLQLAATGNGYQRLNKFLSMSFWKPLARLSLCVCLVNVEVIIYLTQIRTTPISLQTVSHLSLIILSVLASYTMAGVLYVLFEAPIKLLLDHLLSSVIILRKKEVKTTTIITSNRQYELEKANEASKVSD